MIMCYFRKRHCFHDVSAQYNSDREYRQCCDCGRTEKLVPGPKPGHGPWNEDPTYMIWVEVDT